MPADGYWSQQISKATKKSPKQGFLARVDRLRGGLGRLDPVKSNQAYRDGSDALDKVIARYVR